MTTTTEIIGPEERFVRAFRHLSGAALNGSSAVPKERREEAIRLFEASGLPTQKDEAWKYTNIVRALRHEYALEYDGPETTRADVERHLVPGLDAHLLVLVNGRFSEELSQIGALPDGVIVDGFARAYERHADLVDRSFARYADMKGDALTALNTAFTADGVFIHVRANAAIDKPVHVLSLLNTSEDAAVQPRLLYVVERGGQATILESGYSLSQGKTFTNSVTECFVGANAHVEHFKVQDLGNEATQVYNVQVYQERDSIFRTNTVTLSGALVRNNLSFLPDGENCETHLFGLFLGRGRSHMDSHTLVDHAQPHCFSNELYKGILEDEANGVFNGKVYVRPDAQQTNAYQSNKSIVLSERANMYSKPELEIYADDVKCSHGATTGQLDPEALFYLRSRGLSERMARAMLLQAFARDVVDNIRLDPLREMLDEYIVERFHG